MEAIKIKPLSYLQAVGNIAWTALRYPTKYTVIDLSTGKVVGNYTREEYEKFLREMSE